MEKEKKSINLATLIFVGIIIVLIIIGLVAYCLKATAGEEKLLDNLSIDISKKITLNGNYTYPDGCDVGWEFTSDGNVALYGNVNVIEGIYRTVGENLIVIHYTKETVWDENGKELIYDIDWYDYIYVDENKDIYMLEPSKTLVKLERYEDVVNIEYSKN